MIKSTRSKVSEVTFSIVIPAFNEANAIERVVISLMEYAQPIVVDDGSWDETAKFAERGGAIVVSHDRNKGYDAALQTGLFKAIELHYTYAITLDADGQHAPHYIEQFKSALINGADLVVGARDWRQRISETLFSFFANSLWSVADPLCGMKGYNLAHLKRLGHFDSYHSIGTEYTIRCARSKMRIESVPITTRSRSGRSRFGEGVYPNYLIFRALVIGLIKAKRF